MKYDPTQAKSKYYWQAQAKIDAKKERFQSLREFNLYWDEKIKCRR